ncbi:ABC transporter substrate-binding protein [Jiella sp. MQZ9-1]|uniref:ABC transporter substrate-binding protein n=1 Tax=Jiella flava TaxID=2816857 RepID=A0A939FTG8_9HYPH|nr:ABC transporter substrate-binding protein [Jiella flava]MBO0661257.1 ABC transporter substrate-binding protein [Jiella flava]MCD2469902.1 ABC transporter substrate-binding protein [Jiella flava]
MRFLRAVWAALALLATIHVAHAGEAATLRIGVLKFGTVNWELDAMQRAGLDKQAGLDLSVVPFAGETASAVALQGGGVDMIVSDWLWVSRQRAEGADYTFVPYSTSVGSLMVPETSAVNTLGDLKGKTIGVAGGPLDKNWLLIQALAKKDFGIDLAAANTIVYGAPPLLTEKAREGELDAVLNFWHYAARLEAQGFRTLISGSDAAMKMGASGPVASIGWVFRDRFAKDHPDVIADFLKADAATKQLLATSDAAWETLKPLMKAKNEKTFEILRERYRDGIPQRSPADEQKDTAKLYTILANIGGAKLVGPAPALVKGTYYDGKANGS